MILRSWIRPLFTRPVTRPIRKAAARGRPALENRLAPAVQLTYGGPGSVLRLQETAVGSTPAVVISEPTPGVLRIDLGPQTFEPGTTSEATGLTYLTALPGALAGIVWVLYLTGTTVSVPALMGAIMCLGVATSNSIQLVNFANDQRREGYDAKSAALSAGGIRLRPVLMTALAMVVGMLPMSLGLGEGGEQNAPLGRAVSTP